MPRPIHPSTTWPNVYSSFHFSCACSICSACSRPQDCGEQSGPAVSLYGGYRWLAWRWWCPLRLCAIMRPAGSSAAAAAAAVIDGCTDWPHRHRQRWARRGPRGPQASDPARPRLAVARTYWAPSRRQSGWPAAAQPAVDVPTAERHVGSGGTNKRR